MPESPLAKASVRERNKFDRHRAGKESKKRKPSARKEISQTGRAWQGSVSSVKLGGLRNNNGGSFNNLGSNAYWWSSTPNSSANAWYRNLNSGAGVGTSFNRNNTNRSYGFSVRCVRNL